jgi:hypothetical protein
LFLSFDAIILLKKLTITSSKVSYKNNFKSTKYENSDCTKTIEQQ